MRLLTWAHPRQVNGLDTPQRTRARLLDHHMKDDDTQVMNCVTCLFSQKRCDGRDATREGSAETNRSQCGAMVLFLLSQPALVKTGAGSGSRNHIFFSLEGDQHDNNV